MVKSLVGLGPLGSMSAILDLTLAADEFKLGRILRMGGDTRISLESMVPLGERAVPFFRHFDGDVQAFEASVRAHDAVEDLTVVSTHGEERLYALQWLSSTDSFLSILQRSEAHLLEATGGQDRWSFELRFPSHDAVSGFQTTCLEEDVPITVNRLYNPTKPTAGPWYGLTPAQREVLLRAVLTGYYSIPREVSTKDLAAEFGISDQAVVERLRRAIITLTSNTLLIDEGS